MATEIEIERFDETFHGARWLDTVAKVSQRDYERNLLFDHYLIAVSRNDNLGPEVHRFNFAVISVLFHNGEYVSWEMNNVLAFDNQESIFKVTTSGDVASQMLPPTGNSFRMEVIMGSTPGNVLIHPEDEEGQIDPQDDHTVSTIWVRVEMSNDGKWLGERIQSTQDAEEDAEVNVRGDETLTYTITDCFCLVTKRFVAEDIQNFSGAYPVMTTYLSLMESNHRLKYFKIQRRQCFIGKYNEPAYNSYGLYARNETQRYMTKHQDVMVVFGLYSRGTGLPGLLRKQLWRKFRGDLDGRKTYKWAFRQLSCTTVPIAHLMPMEFHEEKNMFHSDYPYIEYVQKKSSERVEIWIFRYGEEGTVGYNTPEYVYRLIVTDTNIFINRATTDPFTPMLMPYEEDLYRELGINSTASVPVERRGKASGTPYDENPPTMRSITNMRNLINKFNDAAKRRAHVMFRGFDCGLCLTCTLGTLRLMDCRIAKKMAN